MKKKKAGPQYFDENDLELLERTSELIPDLDFVVFAAKTVRKKLSTPSKIIRI